jgi:hypothetical protein
MNPLQSAWRIGGLLIALAAAGGAHAQGLSRMSGHSAFRRTMTLMAAGNQLAVVLEAIVLTVETEAPDALCSILLLDDSGQALGASIGRMGNSFLR